MTINQTNLTTAADVLAFAGLKPKKAKRRLLYPECSTCLGSSFKPTGDDFICLTCGAIIDGPWPTWAAKPKPKKGKK